MDSGQGYYKQKEVIEKGDLVRFWIAKNDFNINDITMTLTGEVLGIPYDSGDCWKIKTSKNKIYYIQQYYILELLKKGN